MTRRFFSKLLLVVVAVFGLLVLSSMLSAQGRSQDAFERVKEVQEKHTDRLMAIEGVEGTAVGLDDSERPAVKVFLENPGVRGIPRELDGVPVHPVVTGKFYALPKPEGKPGGGTKIDPTARLPRPVPIGVSTGHPDITAGTIGCRVKDAAGVYALSNNHVYADENKGPIGINVLQPGPYDGGRDPGDAIGTLAAFNTIKFDGSDNTIDAAIALSSTANLGNATPSNGYGTPKSTTAAAYVGQPVQKYGRTTRLTKGKVYAINATVDVGYDSGTARFVNQIIITPGTFSAGGDSGSLVVDASRGSNSRKPVGLLFAGSQFFTVANPIDAVLGAFGVTIDGE
jgi:hypothetical protein